MSEDTSGGGLRGGTSLNQKKQRARGRQKAKDARTEKADGRHLRVGVLAEPPHGLRHLVQLLAAQADADRLEQGRLGKEVLGLEIVGRGGRDGLAALRVDFGVGGGVQVHHLNGLLGVCGLLEGEMRRG